MRKPLNCGGTLMTVTPPPSRSTFPAEGGPIAAPVTSSTDRVVKSATAARRRSAYPIRLWPIPIPGFRSCSRRVSRIPVGTLFVALNLGTAPSIVSAFHFRLIVGRGGSRGRAASTLLPLTERDESKHERGPHGSDNPQVRRHRIRRSGWPAIDGNRGREGLDLSRCEQVQSEPDRRGSGLIRLNLDRQGVFTVCRKRQIRGKTD